MSQISLKQKDVGEKLEEDLPAPMSRKSCGSALQMAPAFSAGLLPVLAVLAAIRIGAFRPPSVGD